MLAVATVVIGLNIGALDLLLGAFGKDATLTGRTYLWAEGLAAARENPFLGVGYQAYWVQGFPEAERLWEEFYIGSRSGFHFHNTYIEVLVELGFVGLCPGRLGDGPGSARPSRQAAERAAATRPPTSCSASA